jgi:hypothetical protein
LFYKSDSFSIRLFSPVSTVLIDSLEKCASYSTLTFKNGPTLALSLIRYIVRIFNLPLRGRRWNSITPPWECARIKKMVNGAILEVLSSYWEKSYYPSIFKGDAPRYFLIIFSKVAQWKIIMWWMKKKVSRCKKPFSGYFIDYIWLCDTWRWVSMINGSIRTRGQ